MADAIDAGLLALAIAVFIKHLHNPIPLHTIAMRLPTNCHSLTNAATIISLTSNSLTFLSQVINRSSD
ncbi:MAG: hypothetical protein K0U18_03660 [Betaproteobacteria bacterium]|nr:hypothetical protein [Betaproteobacteria bacterium]MCH9848966.1 hypothetical protein [Betaproteobacteria bacterium]